MERLAILYRANHGATPQQASALQVVAAVDDRPGSERSGLGEALGRIAEGQARVLVTPRLADLAGSLGELVALLEWLAAADAELVVADVGLDTGSRSGRQTVRLLRELERLEREHESGAPRRGRPGLARREPELGERIQALREGGLSLQAIAEQLQAAGVPTPRGGARWRPSSVQAALGYRRPRPPAPGAPRPPKPPREAGAAKGEKAPKPGRPGHGPPGTKPGEGPRGTKRPGPVPPARKDREPPSHRRKPRA